MSDTANGAGGWRPRTNLVRGGTDRSEFQETCEAIFATSGYIYKTAEEAELAFKGENANYIYSRFSNPTVAMFEKRMALLEGNDACRATATGMAAVFASLMCMLNAGDHVVASRALFGSCLFVVSDILPRYGIEVDIVDGTDLGQWEKALSRPTKAVFLETPSNPGLEVIDLEAVADLTHKAGGRLVVDNVFASPVLQKPLTFGADVVVYSATKHIDGQGRVLGGAILGDPEYMEDHLRMFLRHTGPALSPFNAWTLLKGLETLDIRVRAMCETAAEIAAWMGERTDLPRVVYPGLASHPQRALVEKQMSGPGTLIGFEVPGGKDGAFRFLNALNVMDISNNLGDAKSLVTHPATTTHQRLSEEERAALGITPGYVRISVGLEDPADLMEDIDQALSRAKA
ncbi:MAG TPA: O-succinylhomoserine sulfhydrylase [Alphaproteobacteria bacterium]|nr:O-succinylhomoserine sulfhydrylase [Alphaproteobacteria bacterium]